MCEINLRLQVSGPHLPEDILYLVCVRRLQVVSHQPRSGLQSLNPLLYDELVNHRQVFQTLRTHLNI